MAEKITIRVSFGQAAVSMGIIGRVGENISRQILFDCSSAMTGRTSASIVCVVKRPTDSDPYPVSLTRVGSTDVYRLVLSSAEVAFAGSVQFELRMVDGDEILKAAICTGTVENSMTGIADVPGAAIPDVLNRLESVVEKAENFVELAEDIESATEAATAAAAAANAAMSDLSAFSGPPIIDTAKGLAFVFVEGAPNRPLAGLRVYGRTQQSADPTPEAPVDLVHIGASRGQISIAVNDDLTIAYVDGGLAGIPIDSEDAGNFVDSRGQRWICDEIDFARGVRIQRVARVVCGADNAEFFATGVWKVVSSLGPRTTAPMVVMSTHYKASGRDTAPHGSVYVNLAGDIILMNDKYTSKEVMREDLAANPVTVIFELRTPIETPLDEATLEGFAKFHTSEDEQTTVMNTAAAEIEVDYVADTKAYVDGMVAKTQETANEYELIEEITLDDLTSISRSQTPDGVAYAFSDILIEYSISDQAETAGHTYTTVYADDVTLCSYGIGNAIAASSERYSSVGVNIANGAAVTFATDPGMTPNSLTAMKRKPETAIGVGNITSVSISTNITFPAGSKLTIKAVKA